MKVPFGAVVVTALGVVDAAEEAGAIATVTPEIPVSEVLSTTAPDAVAFEGVPLWMGVGLGAGLPPPPPHAASEAATRTEAAERERIESERVSMRYDNLHRSLLEALRGFSSHWEIRCRIS